MVRRALLVTTLLVGLAAHPAAAHPGHGGVGWVHHGEPIGLAAIVLAALLIRRVTRARSGTRRHEH